ncbi:sel1 repeat family protein, partial [Streptomyces sp. SID2119]|nr:sel1 repeat family protein [Streptomyces sp. SID2119]
EPGAEYWLRQSAEQGHALGAYALADLLEHRGDIGAERWLRAAAEQGHREAAYRLARALERNAVEDPHDAFGLGRGTGRSGLGLSADPAVPDALKKGERGTEENKGGAAGDSPVAGPAAGRIGEAEQWYRRAAARGHRRAALHLGAILEQRGELKEAGRWYLTAAKDGEARAACALGF